MQTFPTSTCNVGMLEVGAAAAAVVVHGTECVIDGRREREGRPCASGVRQTEHAELPIPRFSLEPLIIIEITGIMYYTYTIRFSMK